MSKHIDKKYLYQLPSGAAVHPCRLIHKDGTLIWKHALHSSSNNLFLPRSEAHEAHIIKTIDGKLVSGLNYELSFFVKQMKDISGRVTCS